MVDFGDPTQWLRLLADREDRELRRQALAQQQMQQQLDNAFRAEGRAMDIAENTRRMALLAVQQDAAEFELDVAKRMQPVQERILEARAQNAEQDVQFGKAKLAEMQMDQQFLGFLAPLQQGLSDALGENPTTEQLARSAWSIGKVADFAARKLPAKMRSKVSKGGLQSLLGMPIGAHLESRAKAGDLETAGAILGASPLSDPLSPFVSDEARTAAGRAVEQSLQGVSSSIAAIPDPDYISKVSHGSPQDMLSIIDQQIEAAHAMRSNLNRNVYMIPRFAGDAASADMKAVEKIVDLERERRVISAGIDVLNGQGVVTPMHREGVTKLIGQRVNNVMWGANPGASVAELGETIRKANFVPVAEVAPIFHAATTSADPVSQLKASMVWENLKITMPDRIADLAKELQRIGSFDALETMGDVRRGMGQIEAGILASGTGDGANNPDAQAAMIGYAAQLSDAVSRSIQSRSQEPDATSDKKGGALSGVSADNELTVAQFATVEKYIGANGMYWPWNDGGFLNEVDLSKEEAMSVDDGAMYSFWATEFSRAKGTDANRASYANKATAGRFKKGSLLGDQKVTANHPYNIAKDKFKREDMDVEFTIDFARYQLQKELDRIVTTGGLPARITVDDVDAKPRILRDGSLAWEIRRKGEQEMLGIQVDFTEGPLPEGVNRFEPFVFQPSYTNEDLARAQAELMSVVNTTDGWSNQLAFAQRIDAYLGSESPRNRRKVAEDTKRVQEERKEEAERQRQKVRNVPVRERMQRTPSGPF